MTFAKFVEQFQFRPDLTGYIGVEAEAFLRDDTDFVPRAPEVLAALSSHPMAASFCAELPARQIEWRTEPTLRKNLLQELRRRQQLLDTTVAKLGLQALYREVIPDLPLAISPGERYADILESVPEWKVRAGCRVAGLHAHIGMENWDMALRVYNHAIKHLDELCAMCDHSGGERLKLYKAMADEKWKPQPVRNVNELYILSNLQEWKDPSGWWSLIRISKFGTIEFRPFGTTDDMELADEMAGRCLVICQEVM